MTTDLSCVPGMFVIARESTYDIPRARPSMFYRKVGEELWRALRA